MKKYLILAGAVMLMATLAGCGKDDSEEKATATDAETEEEMNVSIEVLDNDTLTMTYTGFDSENGGMLFTVKNKTDETIDVYFADVIVNGETVQPLVGTDIAAGKTGKDILFIECDEEIPYLNGILFVDDEDGDTIDSFEIKDVCLSEDETSTTETGYDYKDGSVAVFENDNIIVSYVGMDTDSDEPGLIFEVYNKTDELIQATFNSILVNGEEEEPSYVVEIMSGSYATLIADVSDPADVTELTAEIYISDYDDNDIGTYEVEGVSLK